MTIDTSKIQFNDDGLIPAIVQDEQSGDVLMLAYMNETALQKTIETKETWFYSRSRQELWHKGATSGNKQQVKQITIDCDADTLLVQVAPLGPACHTGEETCFFNSLVENEAPSRHIVQELTEEIKHRQANPVEGSYTSYLFREGLDKILKKIGEESSEVIIGAKNRDKQELTSELADLTYHTLVLMAESGVSVEDVKKVLIDRRSNREVRKDD